MNNNDQVVSKIKQIRLEKNFLQKYLADGLGISQTAYGRIENGQTQLTINNLYQIAARLEVKASVLLGIEDLFTFNNNESMVMANVNQGHLVIHLNAEQASELLKKIEKK